MLQKLLFFPLFFLPIFSLFAQTDSLLFLKKAESQIGVEDAQLVDFLMLTMPGREKDVAAQLKRQSLKTYMMPPRKTDETGNTKCYALTACAEYYANYDRNYKVNLSPDYIALSMPQDDLTDAMTFLAKNGTVSADIMPYGSKFIPTSVRAVQKYAITNYLWIFREENKERQKIFALRKAILRGNPVIAEMLVSAQVEMSAADTEMFAAKNNASETAPFVVVGYDETRKTVELLGTYGSGWGENGYLEMSYADFARAAQRAFVLVPER